METEIINELIDKKIERLEQDDEYLKSIGYFESDGSPDEDFDLEDYFITMKKVALARIKGYEEGVVDITNQDVDKMVARKAIQIIEKMR